MSFEQYIASAPLLRALTELGFTTPTPVQASALPPAMAGRDVIASAQTGTGKTAAYLLPALHRLETAKPTPRGAPRILVLSPTRELANQISLAARGFAKHLRVMQGLIVGGVPYGAQSRMLAQRIDLLVATPGRLIDFLDRGAIDLSRVEMLILDEADRMLDMGFLPAVRRLAGSCPRARQTLMFTATWDEAMAKLSADLCQDPERVAIATQPENKIQISQRIYLADTATHKDKLLRSILKRYPDQAAVLFVATKRKADRLSDALAAEGYLAAPMHGDLKQNARERTLAAFKQGRVKLLVATDLAARGIDVNGLALVINIDLPRVAEDYVHRIGRTGRNGASGEAISLIGPDDGPLLGPIERYTGQTLERATMPGLEATQPMVTRAPKAAKPMRRRSQGGGYNPAGQQQARRSGSGHSSQGGMPNRGRSASA